MRFTFSLAVSSVVLLLLGFPMTAQAEASTGATPTPTVITHDPLVGNWNATDLQTGTGTACVSITQVSKNVLHYESSSGDSGDIAKVMGGYAFASSEGGGSGVIQSNGDGTYAWQNNQTGAGGIMTRK